MLFMFSLPGAAEQTFVVTDNSGAPVADAVIMAAGPAPEPSQQPAIMDQVNKRFVPHVLAVPRGQAVEFPNSDDIRHHVYSFSEPKTFEIKLYKGKPGAPVVFDQPGIVVLGCNIHDAMVGYIVVSDTGWWAKTDSEGLASLATDSTIDSVRVWHPRLSANADRVITQQLDPVADRHQISLELQPEQPASTSGFKTDRFKRYAR